tara:strand:+ start:642 stop:905 length:264 start_codon:yes stop_codon:yes gene_type:complete
MTKKEKYYNYVVEDLIKKTEIDYDQEIIKYPHLNFPYPSLIPRMATSSYSELRFSDHIQGKYGIQEDEVGMVWGQYMIRLQTLINNG